MPAFFANIPLWVAPLFLGLLFISLRATRPRTVPKAVIYGLPLLGFLTLRTLASLTPLGFALSAFALAYVAGAAVGSRAQGAWTIATTRSHVRLCGEWLTMVTIMGVFVLNFANGTINAIAPQLAETALYVGAFSILAGVLSGIFFGRALRVMRIPVVAA